MCFSCFLYNLGVFWGLNYSKMANEGPRTYCNTFWMISGTSKILRLVGPIVDPRTSFLLQNYFKEYKEDVETSLKNINSSSMTIQKMTFLEVLPTCFSEI